MSYQSDLATEDPQRALANVAERFRLALDAAAARACAGESAELLHEQVQQQMRGELEIVLVALLRLGSPS